MANPHAAQRNSKQCCFTGRLRDPAEVAEIHDNLPKATHLEHEYRYNDASYKTADYLTRPMLARLKGLKATGAKSILEIGCGNGYLASRMAELGFDVTATDSSRSAIDVAAATYANVSSFAVASVYDAASFAPLGSFDVVVTVEVIEHLQYPRELFRRARERLKPDGRLLLTTPYHGYLKNLAISLLNRWDSHVSVGWDVGHVRFFSPRSMQAIAAEEGFREGAWQGLGRIPGLWKSFLYETAPAGASV